MTSHHQPAPTTRGRQRAIYIDPALLRFWGAFLLLNLLIFLPAYLLNRADATFLPALDNLSHLLGWRDNLDPFRLSAELTLLASLWLFLPRLRHGRWSLSFRTLLALTAVSALLYSLYESISISFYAVDPIIYGQARLVWEELPFLLANLNPAPSLLVAVAAALFATVILLRVLLRALTSPLKAEQIGQGSRLLMGLLLLVVVGAGLSYGRALAAPRSAVSCLGCKLATNIEESLALATRVQTVRDAAYDPGIDYGGYDLLARPDIYLIFIESYGSILYQKESLREPYLALLNDLQSDLEAAGWHSASALSESPTWGGGSWMAYTSALFGLRVDSHPAYLALRDRFATEEYPTLGRNLQQMGYRYVHTIPIATPLPASEQALYDRFFGPDRWVTYEDLAYGGEHYGWGPSPPDQYALAESQALLAAESGTPLFYFTLTQNSHYPWQEVPPLVDDYRTLNDLGAARPDPALTVARPTVNPEDYLAAIEYELRVLTRLITEQLPQDALIVLAGDHQPGYISRRSHGFETPLHVLSQDAGLVAALDEYGLTPGLAVAGLEPSLKHEGLHSLILRLLLDQYGRGDRVLPPYLPDGFQTKTAILTPSQTGP